MFGIRRNNIKKIFCAILLLLFILAFLPLLIGCSDSNDDEYECNHYMPIDYEGYEPEILWISERHGFGSVTEYDRYVFVDADRTTLAGRFSIGMAFRVFVKKDELPNYTETKIANVIARDDGRIVDERLIEFYHNKEYDTSSCYAFTTFVVIDATHNIPYYHTFIGRKIFFVAGEIPDILPDDPIVQIIEVAYNRDAPTNLKTVRNSFRVIFEEN